MRTITLTEAQQKRINRAFDILGCDIFTDAEKYNARIIELCGMLPELSVLLSHSKRKPSEPKGLMRIIKLANEAYNDTDVGHNLVLDSFRTDESEGCTLALFIARELRETVDPDGAEKDQLTSAIRSLETARADLDYVITAFEVRSAELERLEVV